MDRRTKRQKLQDMANQSVSPNEAEIARKKLDALGPEETIKAARGEIYFNGIKVGETFSMEFKFSDPDPGIGVYDFKNERWVWTRKDE